MANAMKWPHDLITLADYERRLVHELTAYDRAEYQRERVGNIYRLGHLLGAKDEAVKIAQERIDRGQEVLEAFTVAVCEVFTPTRGLHKALRNCGVTVDVERGRWVIPARPERLALNPNGGAA